MLRPPMIWMRWTFESNGPMGMEEQIDLSFWGIVTMKYCWF